MSVFEEKGVITYKNKDGDLYCLYPVTKIECVEGMESVGSHIASTQNPHQVDPEQIGAIPVESVATVAEAHAFLGIETSDAVNE